jgi:hypothetical protein
VAPVATEEPVRDLERHIGELRLAGHLPPLAERLQQPRNLTEVAFVAEAVEEGIDHFAGGIRMSAGLDPHNCRDSESSGARTN